MGEREGEGEGALSRASPCLTSKQRFHNAIFYTKFDDHGVRQGDTGRILAQWWHMVASRVALDLPYWVMRLTLYRLIRMAIEITSKGGAFV